MDREQPHGDRWAGLCLGFTALGVTSSLAVKH